MTDDVALVAVSAVQSADGRVADLDAISAAASAAGALDADRRDAGVRLAAA